MIDLNTIDRMQLMFRGVDMLNFFLMEITNSIMYSTQFFLELDGVGDVLPCFNITVENKIMF